MHRTRRAALTIAAAACLIVGAAFGGSVLTAGAANSGSPSGGPGTKAHGSNEATAHEAGESAQREAAEDNGTAGYGRPPGDENGAFVPNENATHESGESADREAAEGAGHAAPTEPQPSTSSGSSGGT
jgi:hypothetical protein